MWAVGLRASCRMVGTCLVSGRLKVFNTVYSVHSWVAL